MGPIKYLLGCFVPHSAVMLARHLAGRRGARLSNQRLAAVRAARLRLPGRPFDYEAAVRLLADRGCDPAQVRAGSIPRDSLEFCARLILESTGRRPVIGLQVGNFVGVSLACFADLARGLAPDSLMIAIDPNVPHRGIADPQGQVMALLDHFGLAANCMVLAGYSLERSEDSALGCEAQLRNLALVARESCDFCVLDGNHAGDYVRREVEAVRPLLKPGGLLFMDDVSVSWPDLARIFESGGGYLKAGWDGRVGVLRKPGAATAPAVSRP